MTSLTRSSITGLRHPRRSMNSTELSSAEDSISSASAVDRILHADKSGFLPAESLASSSRSCSNLDLSTRSSSSNDKFVLEAQIKRALSCSETMEASIKRLRSEAKNSIEDLTSRNESIERALHESKMKISELETQLDQSKRQANSSFDHSSPHTHAEQIGSLEKEKLDLKLQLQQCQSLHSREVTQLEQTINTLKHQLVDTENRLKLNQFHQEQLQSLNQRSTEQILEKSNQIEQLQKSLMEAELSASRTNSSAIVNQSLVDDVKRMNDIRYENERLKKEIELLKLKCNERLLFDEEVRMLRQQATRNNEYRTLIAKHEAELTKLREQLAMENKTDLL